VSNCPNHCIDFPAQTQSLLGIILNLCCHLPFPVSDWCALAPNFHFDRGFFIEKPVRFGFVSKTKSLILIHLLGSFRLLKMFFLLSAHFPRRPAPLATPSPLAGLIRI
jgi:hypothetical protein